MSYWPESLVEEIAAGRVVPFLGAGATSAARNECDQRPPCWQELLLMALDYPAVSDEDKEEASRRIDRQQYLDAAEIIFRRWNPADFNLFLRKSFVDPAYRPSQIHEIIRDLDAKCVITSNYDTLYEEACGTRGFVVRHYHEDNVLNAIRSSRNVILKAHGCVNHADKAVLTRTNYHRVRHQYPSFYALLDGLFLVHTVLFVGVSLTDPDIQLVLENANLAVPCDHPHYALLARGTHPAIIDVIKTAYNIQVLEYEVADDGRDHSDCVAKLAELLSDVQGLRAAGFR